MTFSPGGWPGASSRGTVAREAGRRREAYRNLDFPFERLSWPELHAEARMRLPDLLAYMRSWSASQSWARSRGTDAVEMVRDDLTRAWGPQQKERLVRWPLHGAIGRVT